MMTLTMHPHTTTVINPTFSWFQLLILSSWLIVSVVIGFNINHYHHKLYRHALCYSLSTCYFSSALTNLIAWLLSWYQPLDFKRFSGSQVSSSSITTWCFIPMVKMISIHVQLAWLPRYMLINVPDQMVYWLIFTINTNFMSSCQLQISDPIIFLLWHNRPDKVQRNNSHEVVN